MDLNKKNNISEKEIKENAELLKYMSKEEINNRISKILLCDFVDLTILQELNILKVILPEIDIMKGYDQNNIHHKYDLFDHTANVVNEVKPKLYLRLAALFHDVGKIRTRTYDPITKQCHYYKHQKYSALIAKDILERLKYSNNTINKTIKLIQDHMFDYRNASKKTIKKLIRRIDDKELMYDLIDLFKADQKASVFCEEDYEQLMIFEKEVKKIFEEDEPTYIKDLAINGRDLMSIGFPEGKQIGQTLKNLLELASEDTTKNNKEYLLKKAKEMRD